MGGYGGDHHPSPDTAAVTALAGLAVTVALGQEATVATTVVGQAATAVLLVTVVRRAIEPGEEGGPGPRPAWGP